MSPPVVGTAASAASASPRADEPGSRRDRDARLAALLVAAAGGDCRAFEAFFDATVAMARSVARRILRGAADIEDLLSDAYFEAWRQAARFDVQRGSALTWLLTIVHSRALDQWRRQAARPEEHLADEEDQAADGDTAIDPIEALWRRQSQAALQLALVTLDATERWLLGLAYFRDLSHAEIARCTGLPLGTVKSSLLRSQAKLRERLQPLNSRS